jgi:hypothetical protein
MSTIYLRDVPDDVASDLKELAAREGMSLNRFVVRELAQLARVASNKELLESLPDHPVSTAQIRADIADGRFRNDRP